MSCYVYSYNSSLSGNTSQQLISLTINDTPSNTSCADQALIEWLKNLQIDEMTIERVKI